jgi:hypothetical protein
VLDLLDHTRRDAIESLQPLREKPIPLFRVTKVKGSDTNVFYYYTDPSELDQLKAAGWTGCVTCAQILPSNSGTAVPLLEITDDQDDYFYTTSIDMMNRFLAQKNYNVKKSPGFVFTSPVEGTVPFYIMEAGGGAAPKAHFYTASQADIDKFKVAGYGVTGIICNVFPA